MPHRPYVAFLPPGLRADASLEPEDDWWAWRGHHVHLARARAPEARARLVVVHGAGGHAAALWPIAALLAAEGLDVVAVDLPLYGRTTSQDPAATRYEDWVGLLVDLVDAEDDGRPLVLLGASIGGMLAVEVASRAPGVAAVAATCLLDPGDWRARIRMTRFGALGLPGRALAVLARGRLARLMVPMRAVADVARMSRDPELSRLCASDPLGGGALVPLGFLASYMRHRHAAACAVSVPVTLVHPAEDGWTPVGLSRRVLDRLAGPTDTVMLRECGHFPVEEPGLSDLVDAVRSIVGRIGVPR